MEHSKHTPGPWHYWTSGVNDSGAPKYAVACVESGKDITYSIHNLGDARLIAAAPELLEALKDLLQGVENGGFYKYYPHRVDRARAAIARAEGK